ncbi:MAG: Uma2 family endonuclease [Vulcanimicrobiota bacterium]
MLGQGCPCRQGLKAGPGPGGTLEHDTITANLTGLLHASLRGQDCQVLTSNMKVRTWADGLFSYPDLAVFCGPPRFHDDRRDVLINPRVIIEVLSPSTEEFDRGQKRLLYQTIDTLAEYVLVAQSEPRVEHWARRADAQWLVSTLEGLGAQLQFASIGCSLPLADVYERVSPVSG